MPELSLTNKIFYIIQTVGPVTDAALAKTDGLINIAPGEIQALPWQELSGAGTLKNMLLTGQDKHFDLTRTLGEAEATKWILGQALPVAHP